MSVPVVAYRYVYGVALGEMDNQMARLTGSTQEAMARPSHAADRR